AVVPTVFNGRLHRHRAEQVVGRAIVAVLRKPAALRLEISPQGEGGFAGGRGRQGILRAAQRHGVGRFGLRAGASRLRPGRFFPFFLRLGGGRHLGKERGGKRRGRRFSFPWRSLPWRSF